MYTGEADGSVEAPFGIPPRKVLTSTVLNSIILEI